MGELFIAGNAQALIEKLDDWGAPAIHATNGVYAADLDMIMPTTLAGFKYITDMNEDDDVIVIGINSQKSYEELERAKGASEEEIRQLMPQEFRAGRILGHMGKQFPDKKIAVVFFDEDTPNMLYASLLDAGVELKTLHKWGYGTNPDAPKIEAAELFGRVYGFPLPNDEKPIAWDMTGSENQEDVVQIVKLTETMGWEGHRYITPDGKADFPMAEGNEAFGVQPVSKRFGLAGLIRAFK